MEPQGHVGGTVRTLRLNDTELGKLLDRLDQATINDAELHSANSHPYRVRALKVHFQYLGSATTVPFWVSGRRLSAKRVTFLHGGYVHVGTRCVAQLITSYGTWADVRATVTACRFLESNVHEVVAAFDSEINPAVYCPDAVETSVLLVEDSPMMAKLAQHYLERLDAKFEHVRDGDAAIRSARANRFDVILMDIELQGLNGMSATRELRQQGYTGAIIATTGLTSKESRQNCLAAGCDGFLPKPYTQDDLGNLLRSLRHEPLFSTLHDDPSMRELIRSFVADLPARVRAVESAVVADDVSQIEQVCRNLKGEGRAYGFDVITEVAGRIEAGLQRESGIRGVGDDIKELTKLCAQACAAIPTRMTVAPSCDAGLAEPSAVAP
jgi:CheY-like chemotaxis protein/HPt (histidine-containing phosphotransfer) domain-containing protein